METTQHHPPSEKRPLTLTCAVDSYRSGWTVVEFLAHRFKYHAASGWEMRVRDGRVHVNGADVEPGHVVRKDDAVAYTILHSEPEVDTRYELLYEDDDFFAVSKSGNIPVHACGVFIVHTLIAKLKQDFGSEINLAHRLDRETSGVIVVARHRASNRALADMFARGQVEKTYVAAVYGDVSGDTLDIDAPIGKIDIRYQYPDEYEFGKANDLATYLPKRAVDFEGGKPSQTRCRVVGRTKDDRGRAFTTLQVLPEQGRTNQIRVHLAHAGHPIVGDKIYALSGDVRDELLREGLTERVRDALVTPRHALHCAELRFAHPTTGAPVVIAAPVSEDVAWVMAATAPDRNR